MIYVLFIYVLIKMYLCLVIYQQAHYEIKAYLKHFLYNFIFYDVFILLVLGLSLFTDDRVVLVVCGIFIILYSIIYLFVRKHLHFTTRVIRLLVYLIIYILLIGMIPYVNMWLYALIEFSIMPILLVDILISNYINEGYIKKAKIKLDKYKGKKIIITGSYGKTSTKVLTNQVLGLYSNSIATPKSYNTKLGIARFINESYIDLYDYLVLEYGASRIGDIKSLLKIASPDIAIITEIGYMHIDTFKSIDNIVKEKMLLAEAANIAVLNYDNEYIRSYEFKNKPYIVSYGIDYGDYRALNINNRDFDFYYKNEYISHFSINLLGTHNILNFLAILSISHCLGLDIEKITRISKALESEKNRLEIKKIANRVILDDSFNSNLKGFKSALNILKLQDGKRILLTPGIVEVAKYMAEINNELSIDIASSCDVVILVGVRQTKDLYYRLKAYNLETYVVNDFFEGYSLYQAITKCYRSTALLIENDLPDLYKRRVIF